MSSKSIKGGSIKLVSSWIVYQSTTQRTKSFYITEKKSSEECKRLAAQFKKDTGTTGSVIFISSWVAIFSINGKSTAKSFSVNTYGNLTARQKCVNLLLELFPQRKNYIAESTKLTEELINFIINYLL